MLDLQLEGFGSVSIEPFLVSVGQTVVHRIMMKPSQIVEKLEVRERPDVVDTAATASSAEFEY